MVWKNGGVKLDIKLVGACGLYCGACDHYLGFCDGHKNLLENEKFKGKTEEEVLCRGCHSDKRTPHCEACTMRICADKKGVTVCSECNEYPCSELTEFYKKGDIWEKAAHRKSIMKNLNRIKEVGVENWLGEQEEKWKCQCGRSYSFYEEECSDCKRELVSFAKRGEK